MQHSQTQTLPHDSAERRDLLAKLGHQASISEPLMPNVEVGAICGGDYLLSRGYNVIGQHWLYKREMPLGGHAGVFMFKSIAQVENHSVTAVPVHPYYELEERPGN